MPDTSAVLDYLRNFDPSKLTLEQTLTIVLGACVLVSLHLVQKVVRFTARHSWAGVRWAFKPAPPGPLCRAILAELDNPLSMARGGILAAPGVAVYLGEFSGSVVDVKTGAGNSCRHHLTARELRLIGLKAKGRLTEVLAIQNGIDAAARLVEVQNPAGVPAGWPVGRATKEPGEL